MRRRCSLSDATELCHGEARIRSNSRRIRALYGTYFFQSVRPNRDRVEFSRTSEPHPGKACSRAGFSRSAKKCTTETKQQWFIAVCGRYGVASSSFSDRFFECNPGTDHIISFWNRTWNNRSRGRRSSDCGFETGPSVRGNGSLRSLHEGKLGATGCFGCWGLLCIYARTCADGVNARFLVRTLRPLLRDRYPVRPGVFQKVAASFDAAASRVSAVSKTNLGWLRPRQGTSGFPVRFWLRRATTVHV